MQVIKMSFPSSTLSEVRNSRGVGVGLVREFVRVSRGIAHVLHKGAVLLACPAALARGRG